MAYYLILEFRHEYEAQMMKQAMSVIGTGVSKIVFEGEEATRSAVYAVPEGKASSFTVARTHARTATKENPHGVLPDS